MYFRTYWHCVCALLEHAPSCCLDSNHAIRLALALTSRMYLFSTHVSLLVCSIPSEIVLLAFFSAHPSACVSCVFRKRE